MSLRAFAPPIVIDCALAATRKRVGFTGYSTSFESVEAECLGYEDASVVETYRAAATAARRVRRDSELMTQSRTLDSSSIRVAGALATALLKSPKTQDVHVVDFGGAYGAHFDIARTVLDDRLKQYTIVETPGVVAGLADFSDGTLRWIDTAGGSVADAVGPVDVVISSGTVQYLSNPFRVIQELADAAPHLILDRVPLVEHRENFVMKQHSRYQGKPMSYPAWFFSEAYFYDFLEERHLRVNMRWAVPEDAPFVRRRRRSYSGMLLQTCPRSG